MSEKLSIVSGDEDCSSSSVPPSLTATSSSMEGSGVILEPSKGGPTHLSDIPVKDVIIVIFMLLLWLYSIALIVRAWAKIHNLPGTY